MEDVRVKEKIKSFFSIVGGILVLLLLANLVWTTPLLKGLALGYVGLIVFILLVMTLGAWLVPPK